MSPTIAASPISVAAADWRMTFTFCLLILVLVQVLKLVGAARKPPPVGERTFFWGGLLFAVESMDRIVPAGKGVFLPLLLRFAASFAGFFAGHWLLWNAGRNFGVTGFGLSYLGAPIVWLASVPFCALAQLAYLPTGRLLPSVHNNVFAARGVADFWGQRWNLWMSDWFRQVIFRPMRRRPALAVAVVFLVSGVIHEFVINLGLWLVTGRNQFGSMMVYFGLQAAGLFAERAWLAEHPRLKRVWTWIVVLGPVPLFMNEGMLRVFHFWP